MGGPWNRPWTWTGLGGGQKKWVGQYVDVWSKGAESRLERHRCWQSPLAAIGLQRRSFFEAGPGNPQPGISPPAPRTHRCRHHCTSCHPWHLRQGTRYLASSHFVSCHQGHSIWNLPFKRDSQGYLSSSLMAHYASWCGDTLPGPEMVRNGKLCRRSFSWKILFWEGFGVAVFNPTLSKIHLLWFGGEV